MSGDSQSIHFTLIYPPPTYTLVFLSLTAVHHLFMIFQSVGPSESNSLMPCLSNLFGVYTLNFFISSQGNFICCTWPNLHIYKLRVSTAQQAWSQPSGQGQWRDTKCVNILAIFFPPSYTFYFHSYCLCTLQIKTPGSLKFCFYQRYLLQR